MKRLFALLVSVLLPSMAFAHNPQGLFAVFGVFALVSLVISFFLLRIIARRIQVQNRFIRFALLFLIEIVLFVGITFILSFSIEKLYFLFNI